MTELPQDAEAFACEVSSITASAGSILKFAYPYAAEMIGLTRLKACRAGPGSRAFSSKLILRANRRDGSIEHHLAGIVPTIRRIGRLQQPFERITGGIRPETSTGYRASEIAIGVEFSGRRKNAGRRIVVETVA